MDIEEKVINNVISVLEDVRLLECAKNVEEEFLKRVFRIIDDVHNEK